VLARLWWLTLIILATQEAKQRSEGTQFEVSPGKKFLRDPISKIPNTKKV
jgi:hypothetical protein